MERYDWGRLDRIEVGKFGNLLARNELKLRGVDVQSADVDARSNELIIRVDENTTYDVLVRTVRGSKYIAFRKDRFVLRPDLRVAVVILRQNDPPAFYLIPSEAWKEPNALLVSRDYVGKKSLPEWGINLSRRNMPLLEAYAFNWVAHTLWARSSPAALTESASSQRRGMTVSHGSEVGTAFGFLLKEIEAANEALGEAGAGALKEANYEQARELVEKGSQLVSFRDRVTELREEWGNVFAPVVPRRRKQETSKKAPERLERGLRTPEDASRAPILRALARLRGANPMADALDEVRRLMVQLLEFLREVES